MRYLWVVLLIVLCACSKKEDRPQANTPHVAGSWAGTGTDDAIGFYNISMDVVQSGNTATGSFTMTGGVAAVSGDVAIALGPQGGNNLQSLRLSREHWTVNDPANANRLCAGVLSIRANSSAMTAGATTFQYTMTDCQGGTWTGGAHLTKLMGTN